MNKFEMLLNQSACSSDSIPEDIRSLVPGVTADNWPQLWSLMTDDQRAVLRIATMMTELKAVWPQLAALIALPRAEWSTIYALLDQAVEALLAARQVAAERLRG